MTNKNKTKPRSKAQVDEKPTGPRSPRTIRFTDAEWAKVQRAAEAANISTATFACNVVLHAADEFTTASGGALPPGILELVKRTYRSAYILSTLNPSWHFSAACVPYWFDSTRYFSRSIPTWPHIL